MEKRALREILVWRNQDKIFLRRKPSFNLSREMGKAA